ncbi:ribonuclease P protein subunit [Candidatus Woesearchaeota archaeon]|nr:ribonuclease P protein subunit [Candidatus Woesearchaeota archaeon]
MILKGSIQKQEFIGKQIAITAASNSSLVGMKGKVIDETKGTFTILTPKGERKIIKRQITFKTRINNLTYELKGKVLENRPEERVKKVRRNT